jgi:hypothetical protein
MERQRTVYRVSADGLSRECWNFDHRGHCLTLRSYGIERRKVAKGRFSGATIPERWQAIDERRHNSRLERPTTIPYDVIVEAAAFTMCVNIGWTNSESKYCDIALTATTPPEENK